MLEGAAAAAFMDTVLNQDEVKGLLSSEHFSVDGTLIQAWASMKSFRRKSRPSGLTRGTARTNHSRPSEAYSGKTRLGGRIRIIWVPHRS